MWFRKGLEHEFADKMFRGKALVDLGNCYEEKYDYATAVEYYEKAAKEGFDEAQYDYGRCWYYGRGVPKNKDVARALIEVAAKTGYQPAIDFLRDHF